MSRAYVGLGSNVGEPPKQLAGALEELHALPATRLVQRSALYRSGAVGYAGQPDFVNAVAILETELEPEALLAELQGIEARHGRRRSFPNAPRTLDLDLLLYDQRVVESARLTLPHPRMHQRAFVLRPLLELEPDIAIPQHGGARALLAACSGQRVEQIGA